MPNLCYFQGWKQQDGKSSKDLEELISEDSITLPQPQAFLSGLAITPIMLSQIRGKMYVVFLYIQKTTGVTYFNITNDKQAFCEDFSNMHYAKLCWSHLWCLRGPAVQSCSFPKNRQLLTKRGPGCEQIQLWSWPKECLQVPWPAVAPWNCCSSFPIQAGHIHSDPRQKALLLNTAWGGRRKGRTKGIYQFNVGTSALLGCYYTAKYSDW